MNIDAFIERWSQARGGAERANYQMFLSELCEAFDLPRPDPASDDTRTNDYVFERGVKRRESEGLASTLRIDLYKRGCFILEAKQSRAAHREDQPRLFTDAEAASTAAGEGRWDTLMRNARKQAEDYVFRLPADHAAPPFIIVCDVGYVFEVYADFSGSGRAYTHFPDRKRFRIRLEDLRDEKVVARLKAIWTDPQSLDPTRESARVTRQIAERLAAVSRRLERSHPPEEVAHFLMRCIFTMFAEDVDLLPRGKFTALLEECIDGPDSFAPLLRDLWKRMDDPVYDNRFFSGFKTHLRHFNGSLFKDARAFSMTKEEIGELLAASKHDWRYVEPAIFGTLVEQALDPAERRQLGAHYTPRAYVERLVQVTVMEPLRADWADALVRVADARERGEAKEAVDLVRAFHHQLCATRVLDPACGTGNFLYVSLELMKRLEGEVLETLAELGETESIGFETVDPHQFLGIELNVRAAAIAELVLWIGYLQQHYRNSVEHPAEPILKAFGNIQQKDAVLTWDGYPELQFEMRDGEAVQVYPNARRPEWPEAEFIVGNPPFSGVRNMRTTLGTDYVDALRGTYPGVPDTSDYVAYWWGMAADRTAHGTVRRFGLITTNSITQPYSRGIIRQYIRDPKRPVRIIFAVADHPWVDTSDGADVRVAIQVVEPVGSSARTPAIGIVSEVDGHAEVSPVQVSAISEALTEDLGLQSVGALNANVSMCFQGVVPAGDGFKLDSREGARFAADSAGSGLIRRYLIGRDLMQSSAQRLIIDAFGWDPDQLRRQYPDIYGHLLEHVKPVRATNARRQYRELWWIFAEPRPAMRDALTELSRYIGTANTSKHRVFAFIPEDIIPDAMVYAITSDDSFLLSALSSRHHTLWSAQSGSRMGVGNDLRYTKSLTFDPFPFPDPDEATRARLRDLGEELDARRKTAQVEHRDLTLTSLYNVLEKLRAGVELSDAETDVKARGRVLILKDLHDQIDRATADAYGWPHDLTDEQILKRLVALNAERAAEEAAGRVRWLRPDYQIPRFAKGAVAPKSGELDLGEAVVALNKGLPAFPKDKAEQPLAIRAVLEASGCPMDAAAVSRAFKGGGKKIEQRVVQALNTLVRYGWITALPNETFAARRAA